MDLHCRVGYRPVPENVIAIIARETAQVCRTCSKFKFPAQNSFILHSLTGVAISTRELDHSSRREGCKHPHHSNGHNQTQFVSLLLLLGFFLLILSQLTLVYRVNSPRPPSVARLSSALPIGLRLRSTPLPTLNSPMITKSTYGRLQSGSFFIHLHHSSFLFFVLNSRH